MTPGTGDRLSPRVSRHLLVLRSLECLVCRAPAHTACDLDVHLVAAAARLDCVSCGAMVGESCTPACEDLELFINTFEGLAEI